MDGLQRLVQPKGLNVTLWFLVWQKCQKPMKRFATNWAFSELFWNVLDHFSSSRVEHARDHCQLRIVPVTVPNVSSSNWQLLADYNRTLSPGGRTEIDGSRGPRTVSFWERVKHATFIKPIPYPKWIKMVYFVFVLKRIFQQFETSKSLLSEALPETNTWIYRHQPQALQCSGGGRHVAGIDFRNLLNHSWILLPAGFRKVNYWFEGQAVTFDPCFTWCQSTIKHFFTLIEVSLQLFFVQGPDCELWKDQKSTLSWCAWAGPRCKLLHWHLWGSWNWFVAHSFQESFPLQLARHLDSVPANLLFEIEEGLRSTCSDTVFLSRKCAGLWWPFNRPRSCVAAWEVRWPAQYDLWDRPYDHLRQS